MLNESVLVFGPHHDDESIGCGGQMRLMSKQGMVVNLAIVTSGFSGVEGSTESEAIQIREQEALQASEILGVKDVTFMRLKDHALVFNEDHLHEFIKVVRKFKPTTIYLPHKEDGDRDHRIVNELGREAAWLAGVSAILPTIEPIRHRIKTLFYEVWTPLPSPHMAVVIDDVWDAKKQAIEQYVSQICTANYVQMAQGLNAYRAVQQHTRAAFVECFSYS